MKDSILSQIENYVFEYFKNNAPAENVYHNISHVQFVVNMVKEISDKTGVSEEDLEILQISAWFHDLGHIKTWEGHEEVSAKLAEKYLNDINYPKASIKKVVGCILATRIPHKPNNLLEEIICDADIAHIGTKDFFDLSDLLKLEIETRKNKKLPDSEWLNKNIEFLTKSKFFTKYAKKTFEETKNTNLLKLQERLNENSLFK